MIKVKRCIKAGIKKSNGIGLLKAIDMITNEIMLHIANRKYLTTNLTFIFVIRFSYILKPGNPLRYRVIGGTHPHRPILIPGLIRGG